MQKNLLTTLIISGCSAAIAGSSFCPWENENIPTVPQKEIILKDQQKISFPVTLAYTKLWESNANFTFSISGDLSQYQGEILCRVISLPSGKELLNLSTRETPAFIPWYRKFVKGVLLSGNANTPEKELSVIIEGKGKGSALLTGFAVTPPRTIPTIQIYEWYNADRNHILAPVLTYSVKGFKPEALAGTFDIVKKELAQLGITLEHKEYGGTLLMEIAPRHRVFEEPRAGYKFQAYPDKIGIQSNTVAGISNGLITMLGLIDHYNGKLALPASALCDYPSQFIRAAADIDLELAAKLKLSGIFPGKSLPDEKRCNSYGLSVLKKDQFRILPSGMTGKELKEWGRKGIASVIKSNGTILPFMQAKQAKQYAFPIEGLIASPSENLIEFAQRAWHTPRRTEIGFTEISGLDPHPWSGMKPVWQPHTIKIGKFGEPAWGCFPAQVLKFEAPANKILAVPVLVKLKEKGHLMLTGNTEYADGRSTHYAIQMFSKDNGKTWSPVEFMNKSSSDFFGANSLTSCLANGDIMVYPVVRETIQNRYISKDQGKTWQPHSPLSFKSNFFGNWDPPLIARDGSVWETLYYLDEKRREIPYYRVSIDNGKTFGPDIEPAEWKAAGANEVKLFETSNGTILAGCRLFVPAANDQSNALGVSYSTDRGKTWSKVQIIQPAGRMHPAFVELPDKRIILTYVVRNGYPDDEKGHPRFGIEAVESKDGGKTWDVDRPYRLAETTGLYLTGENRWASSVQSTVSILLDDGSIMTVFGTGHRAVFNHKKRQVPRDFWIVRWTPPALKYTEK